MKVQEYSKIDAQPESAGAASVHNMSNASSLTAYSHSQTQSSQRYPLLLGTRPPFTKPNVTAENPLLLQESVSNDSDPNIIKINLFSTHIPTQHVQNINQEKSRQLTSESSVHTGLTDEFRTVKINKPLFVARGEADLRASLAHPARRPPVPSASAARTTLPQASRARVQDEQQHRGNATPPSARP